MDTHRHTFDSPVEVCEERDIKGFYKKARRGEIKRFTGVSDPYEIPKKPDISIKTVGKKSLDEALKVISYLEKNGFLNYQ